MFIIAKTYAYHYSELVLKNVEDLGLNFTLCTGQTYDNAATMKLSGLYMRILYINPKATFLNCDNYQFNLATLHSAEVDPAIVTSLGTVQELFTFLEYFLQRWAKLKEVGV